ncbi:hypothetical protein Scep_000057 [Stephania cephalantha]|uniref:Uncharacterized protein n=1 Tax=Stephania cephalantha TaxID=152367 RepID=A0AAP0L5U4_9MAGN
MGNAKKLGLWHTKTFRPITTHQELEPIMARLGFAVSPATAVPGWIEYHYVAARLRRDLSTSAELPIPRLPYPRIDGLHVSTYLPFFDALTFYLGDCLVADHLHGKKIKAMLDPSKPIIDSHILLTFFKALLKLELQRTHAHFGSYTLACYV